MGILQDRIKLARERSGLTLLEVAEELGVKEATVQRYESGNIKNIKHEMIVQMAKLFNVTPAYLMGWEEDLISPPAQGYYINPETAAIAQEIFERPDMRILFDASRNATPEDMKKIIEMTKIMVPNYDDEPC